MAYQLTRPDTDQVKFTSSKTGNHILEEYLQDAELGNRTLAQLMGDLFDAAGVVKTAISNGTPVSPLMAGVVALATAALVREALDAPSRTGDGASGNWNINAATATNAGHAGTAGDSGAVGGVSLSQLAQLAVAQNFTAPQRAALTTDNDLSFDLSAKQAFKCTPTAGGTLSFTNIPDGLPVTLLLVNGSNYAIAAAATTKISVADLAKISATGTYLLSGLSDGTNVYLVASESLA